MAIGIADVGGGIASGVADAIRLFGPGMIDQRQAQQKLQQQQAQRERENQAIQTLHQMMLDPESTTSDIAAYRENVNILFSSDDPMKHKFALGALDYLKQQSAQRVPDVLQRERAVYDFDPIEAPPPQPQAGGYSFGPGRTPSPIPQRAGDPTAFTATRPPPFAPVLPTASPHMQKVALPAPGGIPQRRDAPQMAAPVQIPQTAPQRPWRQGFVKEDVPIETLTGAQLATMTAEQQRAIQRQGEMQGAAARRAADADYRDRTHSIRERELDLRERQQAERAEAPGAAAGWDRVAAALTEAKNNPDDHAAFLRFLAEYKNVYGALTSDMKRTLFGPVMPDVSQLAMKFFQELISERSVLGIETTDEERQQLWNASWRDAEFLVEAMEAGGRPAAQTQLTPEQTQRPQVFSPPPDSLSGPEAAWGKRGAADPTVVAPGGGDFMPTTDDVRSRAAQHLATSMSTQQLQQMLQRARDSGDEDAVQTFQAAIEIRRNQQIQDSDSVGVQ